MAIGFLLSNAVVSAEEVTTQELQAQIKALEAKVQALEAQRVATSDVDALVRSVLADAQQRSQLMSSEGFTAGYSKGQFIIQSADGNFRFIPVAQFQERYVANYREDGKHGGNSSSTDDGFELRRAKFGFAGNAGSPALTYKLLWQVPRKTGNVSLEEAWVRYELNRNFAIFGGQFEDRVSKDQVTSSSKTLAIEQALATNLLIEGPLDYVQGVGLAYQQNRFRVQGVFHDGANSDNTNFQNGATYFGVSGRAEYRAQGDDWKAYDDYTARGNKQSLLVFGAGADLTQAPDVDRVHYAADVQWEPQAIAGLSVFASYLGESLRPDAGADINNHGLIAQAGYLLSDRWEVFGRYDIVFLDDQVVPVGGSDRAQEFTLGVNYYIRGHSAKFTADVVYLPDGSPQNVDGLGILAGNAEQLLTRMQFQLVL